MDTKSTTEQAPRTKQVEHFTMICTTTPDACAVSAASTVDPSSGRRLASVTARDTGYVIQVEVAS